MNFFGVCIKIIKYTGIKEGNDERRTTNDKRQKAKGERQKTKGERRKAKDKRQKAKEGRATLPLICKSIMQLYTGVKVSIYTA